MNFTNPITDVSATEATHSVDASLAIVEADYWICTCGYENEGADLFASCQLNLHDREPEWVVEPILVSDRATEGIEP